jgi:hypothetical protein
VKSLLLAAALAAVFPLEAATYRVDDTTSMPRENQTPMRWRSLAPNRAMGNDVEGNAVVTLRLNLAPWVNKQGKIFLALPEQSVGQVSAEWTTQGKLINGQVTSGNRTLVYAGPIRAALLEETIVMRIWTDGRRLVAPQRLDFQFEIDVD